MVCPLHFESQIFSTGKSSFYPFQRLYSVAFCESFKSFVIWNFLSFSGGSSSLIVSRDFKGIFYCEGVNINLKVEAVVGRIYVLKN